jgi:hypothetical protein
LNRESDELKYTIYIGEHIVIPESQYEITKRFENLGSVGVGSDPISVLSTVDLNDQFCVQAHKVDDESIDWKLALEF